MSENRNSVLVIFTSNFPKKSSRWWRQFEVVVAPKELEKSVSKKITFIDIDSLVRPSSIYEASAFAEELSRLKLSDGLSLPKLFTYKGYELWWAHYNELFLYFCLPYTQHKELLEYLGGFRNIFLCEFPYKNLFIYYLKSKGRNVTTFRMSRLKTSLLPPFGVLLQILITLLSLLVLIFRRNRLMVFIGDKFEKSKDYDFRMKFIYEELRGRGLPFVEFVRSLEPWRKVLRNAFVRKRPVVYSEAVSFVARLLSFVSGGRISASRKINSRVFDLNRDPEAQFKYLVAANHLFAVQDDVWAIRIMKLVLGLIGVKVSFIAATLERNFHSVLGCKLNSIPIIGILHGVASKHYNVYDFMPAFDGEKTLSVDRYGLWSDWWREYYVENSKAYLPEQLHVSGPMRPQEGSDDKRIFDVAREKRPVRVLFVSEQLAVPHEVVPYLEALLREGSVKVLFTFRPYRDGFKGWLIENRPDLLKRKDIEIPKEGLQNAIKESDVVVGSHSTTVLEALFQYRVPIFFKTRKWGDYFNLENFGENHPFFANDTEEFIEKVKDARAVSRDDLSELLERFFGDPHKNGSKWVVDQMEGVLLKKYADR